MEAAVFVGAMPDVAFFAAGAGTMVRLTYKSGMAAFERIFPIEDWEAYIERERQRLVEWHVAKLGG